MRYKPLNQRLYTKNREKLVKELLPKSLAVFNANDILPTNADGSLALVQNSDLYYMCGVNQEETILLIAPEHPVAELREVLFLRETNEEIAIWEGHKLTKDEARKLTGIENIQWLSEFPRLFNHIAVECDNIYLNTNEHLRAVIEVETRDRRFLKWCQEKYPLHKFCRLAPIMHHLRAIKEKEEIETIKHACSITEKGFRRVLDFVKPNVYEFEVEAEYTHEFIRNRSRGSAYTPIIASGFNACVLHYIENKDVCKKGELLLMDIGAEYANYASDMTRVIPVSGKFSKRQKDVYNAVLRVMRGAMDMLVEGNVMDEYVTEVGKLMESELIGLKLLKKSDVEKQDKKNPLYKKYFPHGTSHHLGIDVHDYGNKYRKFEAGMVFTCEPGIYIREESLGIRLENNLVITKNKPLDLMASIPLEADEIEALMNA